MFCSECGKPARGKFCSECGAPLAVAGYSDPAAAPVIAATAADAQETAVTPDWEHETRYETILKFPGVRSMVERHDRMATKRMSGEEFLKLAEKIVPLAGIPKGVVPLDKLAPFAQGIFTRLGVKTGKERSAQIAAPVGKVIVRALCSLAQRGQLLKSVSQADDGCTFSASLPSDMFALEGDLTVTVRRDGASSTVSAVTNIGGQLYDWGKSSRCLDQLFNDLHREAA